MIILHQLKRSRSTRIIWLLEELGIPYELKDHELDSKTGFAAATVLTVNPMGTVPIIQDGDLTLGESGAIVEYLLYKYGVGKLKPTEGSAEWIQYLYWLHFAEGTLMNILTLKLVFDRVHEKSPFLIKPIVKMIKSTVSSAYIQPRVSRILNLLETTLQKTQYLSGAEFTAADIQMGLPVIVSSLLHDQYGDRPHIQAYIERLRSRPAYIRMTELAGLNAS